MAKKLTVREIVDRMGGRKAVASRYGVGVTAVGNWITANTFPDRLHWRVARDCAALGLPLDPATLAVAA